MFTRFASYSIFPALFFSLLLLTSCSSGPDAADFDISGFKLGLPASPDIKKKVEALPEGYKCLDIKVEEKLMGYTCYAPVAPSSSLVRAYLERLNTNLSPNDEVSKYNQIMDNVTHYLVLAFDGYSGKVWYIYKEEVLKNQPLRATMYEALRKKYGEFKEGSSRSFGDIFWSFYRNGKKSSEGELNAYGSGTEYGQVEGSGLSSAVRSGILGSRSSNPDIIVYGANQGVCLTAEVICSGYGDMEGCSAYALTLYDPRPYYDRKVAAKAKEEAAKEANEKAEEKRKKAVSAPTF